MAGGTHECTGGRTPGRLLARQAARHARHWTRHAVGDGNVRERSDEEGRRYVAADSAVTIPTYESIAASNSAIDSCSSSVCATRNDPGPKSSGTPHRSSSGISVVNGKLRE